MAKSNAERLREFKARKKEREKIASLTLDGVFKTPFFETLDADFHFSSEFADNFEFMGIPTPRFVDDQGPEQHTDYSRAIGGPSFDANPRSLGRAELMVTALVEAAKYLAIEVQAYKRNEIKARLAELEASDLSDPATKKAALANAARLNKMLDQLDKQVRITFPQWKVTG